MALAHVANAVVRIALLIQFAVVSGPDVPVDARVFDALPRASPRFVDVAGVVKIKIFNLALAGNFTAETGEALVVLLTRTTVVSFSVRAQRAFTIDAAFH